MSGGPWWDGNLIALDTETTGPNPETAAIVTAHVSLVDPLGGATGRTLIIDPGVPVPDDAAAVHGWTTERVRAEGVERRFGIGALYGLLRRFVGRTPIVAYNAAYDCTVIERELQRMGLPSLRLDDGPIIDPFVIDKATDQYRRGKRTLTATCALYGVPLLDAHEASSDALAAVGLARVLGRRFGVEQPPGVPQLADDARLLHRQQRLWRKVQQDSLRAYFERQGIAHDGCAPAWPVRPLGGRPLAPIDGSS